MVCVSLFIRLRVESAALCSLLGAYFLLPSNLTVEVPLLPPIDKTSLSVLTTFFLCWIKSPMSPARRPSIIVYLLSFAIVLSPLLTSFGNSYELRTAAGSIPGFYISDASKYVGRQLIEVLPLFIGLRFLSTDYGRSLLLVSVPLAILLYSPLMLFEIRMSPQLHTWVYGYLPSAFSQQYRNGGFRPVVFLSHGLELALITSVALVSAAALAKNKQRVSRAPASVLSAYFAGLLVLCKSLGAAIYAILLLPVLWFTGPKTWAKIACGILIFISVYPALRTAHLIPIETAKNISDLVSADRSDSFQMRVRNEEQLLAKANQKPFFGWGTWGRNRIFDQWTGQSISVTDGGWIIIFGVWGWFGYLATFLLFAVCSIRAHRSIDREVTSLSITLGGLTLALLVYVLNMLPNTTNMMLPFLIAGSIAPSAKAGVRKRKLPESRLPTDPQAEVVPV